MRSNTGSKRVAGDFLRLRFVARDGKEVQDDGEMVGQFVVGEDEAFGVVALFQLDEKALRLYVSPKR
jgi:hypothetical protein